MSDKSEIDLETPLRFIPPNGPDAEWQPAQTWSAAEWRHWLLQHNQYPYLKTWTEEEITQYLQVDRYRYGIGLQNRKDGPVQWFYNPSPIAVPFHASKCPNILFGGAAGGTKSQSARGDAIFHAMAIPKYHGIIMRRTMPELRDNHLDQIKSLTAEINYFLKEERFHYYTDDRLEVDVHGPGKAGVVKFGHCQHLGDENKYLGPAYDGFYPDEAATFEKKQIVGIAGRLRSDKVLPGGRKVVPRMGAMSNPGGAHTLWLKRWFMDKDERNIRIEENPRYRAENYQFIQAMLWDNPYYMDPDGTYTTYEDRLGAHDPERRRQLLLGDWNALAGQFFPEFRNQQYTNSHVATLHIPEGCKIERWIDWGYDPHYGICLWVACFPNGRLYVFYEWKFNGASAPYKMVASEVAKKIRAYTLDEVLPLVRGKRITRSIADPSMWGKDGHTGEDYAETFRKNGVALIKADHERVMGWGRMRAWLRNAPDGMPWMLFHPRCETTIRTLPGLVRDDSDPDDVNTKGEDHPGDAIRYGVMARPTPTVMRLESPIILPETGADILRQMTQIQARQIGMVS